MLAMNSVGPSSAQPVGSRKSSESHWLVRCGLDLAVIGALNGRSSGVPRISTPLLIARSVPVTPSMNTVELSTFGNTRTTVCLRATSGTRLSSYWTVCTISIRSMLRSGPPPAGGVADNW